MLSEIRIEKKGITAIPADCIVNAANEGLWEGGGVCGAIFRAAGSQELTKVCQDIGHCDTGSAVITPAFGLPAKYIIHAVGPVWRGGKNGEPGLLYDCYKKSLELAMAHDCHSIVFPLISSGIFGYPKAEAWKKAVQACSKFIRRNPDYAIQVIFAVPDQSIAAMGENALKGIYGEKTSKASEEVKASGRKADARAERIAVFQDTQNWIKTNPKLGASVAYSKMKTSLYYEDDYPAFDASAERNQLVTVTRNRSYQAAVLLAKENPDAKIAVMNFANAFHAGGGVTRGSSAQEESLCRCSTLYPLLYRRSLRDSFYKHHADLNTPKASDSLIYTEGVCICKTDTDHPQRLPEEEWTYVDVITIAAPDLRKKSNAYVGLVDGGSSMNSAELFGYHVKRAIHMLTVAAHKGADILVLGAFGCGAFQNDPRVVARAYACALREFPRAFSKIEFAIYGAGYDKNDNFSAFKEVLGE